jgi:ABC-type transport system involved in multi-copper enzyme maturation permease subunit
MIVLPVIVRELIAESRRPANYWLRLLGPAALLVFFLPIVLSDAHLALGQGGYLFGNWNGILFLAIWMVAPLLTADCISRERREGTLGLLFLTPLKPGSIVGAKSLVHALRALAVLLSAIPVLTIPLLIGGVSGADILRAVLLDAGALLLALMAGLRASSLSREWSRAMALAICLSFGFALIYIQLHSLLLVGGLPRLDSSLALITGAKGGWGMGGGPRAVVFGGPLIGGPGFGGPGWGGPAPGLAIPGMAFRVGGPAPALAIPVAALKVAAQMFAVSAGVVAVMLFAAARRLKRNWREEPPSLRKQWWLQTFCSPRYWQKFFRRRMSRTLDRNPVGWLQQYSWTARLAKWGWCFALVFYESFFFPFGDWNARLSWQLWPTLGVIAGMAFSAANSFGRERQTGAMELMLVTPLRVRQIINGRLQGIWSQFLPTFAVWLIIWLMLYGVFDVHGMSFLIFFLGSFVAIAVIGLYFSMFRIHFLTAWLMTGIAGLALPALLASCAQFVVLGTVMSVGIYLNSQASSRLPIWFHPFLIFIVCFTGFQFLLAILAWSRLNRNLSRRTFAARD